MNFFDRAARRRGELLIPEPTLEQALAHLNMAVKKADEANVRSPTIEAIRKVLGYACPDPSKSS